MRLSCLRPCLVPAGENEQTRLLDSIRLIRTCALIDASCMDVATGTRWSAEDLAQQSAIGVTTIGKTTNEASAAYAEGKRRWQEPKASRNWCSTTSRATRNSQRRFCARASTRCSPATWRPARQSYATTSRRPSALKSSGQQLAHRQRA